MAFDISKFLNAESKQVIKNNFKLVKVSVHKMRPAPDKENFYHINDEEIETLARTIELVGIQQNSVLKPIPDTDEFEIIAGHKRRLAVLKLIGEGKREYEMMDCKIEETGDDIRNELILIFTNSTQRDRTDYEKMHEIKRVKELLVEYQKDNNLPGKKQDIIAIILGTNKTKIGTLENIYHNLIEEFKEEFAVGNISTSTANEISGLDQEAQKALYETYKATGSLKAKDAKEIKAAAEDEQLEGQDNIMNHPEYLPEQQEGYTDFEPDPDKVESLCYNCIHWSECDQKSNTVANCKDYINKTEALKSDKQREQEEYDKQQAALDKQTKEKLWQQEQEEKMNHLPSDAGKKSHEIRLAAMYFDDVQSGKKTFELLKNDNYKAGDILIRTEYLDGKSTGRHIKAEIVYIQEDCNGLEEGYCILGTKLLNSN